MVEYTRVILGGFVVVVMLALLVAGSTSGGSFGTYNPAWDGTAEFRPIGEETDADLTIGRNASVYRSVETNGTTAVILSPEQRYGDTESEAIREYVRNGGTVVVAEDAGPNGNRLLRDVGARARFDGATLRDERNYENGPALPVTTTVGTNEYTTNVETLVLNHGTAIGVNDSTSQRGTNTTLSHVNTTNVTVLATSSPYSYLDRNGNEALDDSERVREVPVVTVERVGQGWVIAVSDPSLFINAMLERGDNRQFARNIYEHSDRVVLDVSHAGGVPPLRALVLVLRESALLQAVVGSILVTAIVGWSALTEGVASLAGRFSREKPSLPPRDRETVVRGIQDRHPDWDPDRIKRVTQAIMDRQSEGKSNG